MKLKCSSCYHIGDSTSPEFDADKRQGTWDHIQCIDYDLPNDGLPRQTGGQAYPVEEGE